jgi:hypothetical protein
MAENLVLKEFFKIYEVAAPAYSNLIATREDADRVASSMGDESSVTVIEHSVNSFSPNSKQDTIVESLDLLESILKGYSDSIARTDGLTTVHNLRQLLT